MFKSESRILNFIRKSAPYRRNNFQGSGTYFDLIFLCGKKLEENDNRSFIKNQIELNKKFSLLSEFLYTEFDDLDLDLLTIEEILLSVCASTILIVESFGSACELGAFSFSSKNIEKLWVINNKDFRNDGSFIANGPIRKIENISSDHVIYQKFKNADIDFDNQSFELFKKVGRKGFSKEPVSKSDNKVLIKDLGFIVCILFDYIRLFGVLFEESVIEVLKTLYQADEFIIELPSGDTIDKELTGIIIKKLLVILTKSEIITKKYLRKRPYYTMNFETMNRVQMAPSNFSSFIFKSSFFTFSNKKELCRLKNFEKQEGLLIWTE